MFSCPNCGGNVTFDIPSQRLTCEYCHEAFSPYAFESKTSDAEEAASCENDYEVTIFTCPQCGGEILSTDNAAAGFCSFCGASTILYSRISHERRPNYIIPFQKSKEDCKQAYTSLIKKALFAPKELKDPQCIDSFRGIYMPYWAFYITQKGELNLPAKKVYRRGNYIYTDHYRLHGELDSYYKGLSYDASSSFADSISEALAPYDLKGMKAFTPAYLSGFYADTADVAPSVYQQDAEATACSQTSAQLLNVPQYSGCQIDGLSGGNAAPLLFTKTAEIDAAMFPVWFMSYRNRDRVAYVTVNGQTGKIVADLPIDPKKYALSSLLLAIPLFILFALFLTLLPSRLLALSGILALAASAICTSELRAIARKDSGAEDRGRMYRDSKQRHSGSGSARPIWLPVLAYVLLILGCVLLPMLTDAVRFTFPLVVWICIMIGMAAVLAAGHGKLNAIPGQKRLLGMAVSCIAVAAGAAITLLNPVSDLWYYGGTTFGLLAVILSISDVIHYYNVLSTRRLPQFDKQGGDDRA